VAEKQDKGSLTRIRLALGMAGFGTVFAGVLLMSWEHARMEKKA